MASRSAAAACSGARVRRQQVREANRILAHEAFLRHHKELQKKARNAFAQYKTFVALADHVKGTMTVEEEEEYEYYLKEAKLEDFMESVMGIPKESLDQDALQMVKDTARANQQKKLERDRQKKRRTSEPEQSQDLTAADTTDPAGATTTTDVPTTTTFVIPKRHYTQHALLNAIDKYDFYLQNGQKIHDIFKEFDTNKDGELSRSELRDALQEYERKYANRNVRGVHVFLVVSNKDLDFILQQADADHSGKINRAELLPALAIWEELAALHIQEKENGCACVIL